MHTLHRTRPHRSRQRGFTLVELMVVVAIIAVIGMFMFGVSSKPYGANPSSIADQVVGTLNLAKLRAVSTRRWHRVQVTGPAAATPNAVVLWQFDTVGMANPALVGTGTWQVVQMSTLPGNVSVWDASTTRYAAAGVATVTQDTALDFNLDFKPDGSSTGGTLFLADREGAHPYRLLVYPATGSSYARQSW